MRIANPDRLLTAADLSATLLFAIEGATAAVLAGADLFGIVVIAFVTALGGGIIRDVVIGDLPVAAVRWVRYPAVALSGAAIVIVLYQSVERLAPELIMVLDACGLGLFCVAGAAKARDLGLSVLPAALVATITGCGGGMIRDVLLNQIPIVLRQHIYAVAALAGAVAMLLLDRLGAPRWLSMSVGAAVATTLRVLSVVLNWNLPEIH
ncbi:MAG: trimeric intracellular cation channel family protein [Antricoccus sp.]